MRALITGGAGYIGSLLTNSLLEAGHEVTVLDNLMYGSNSLFRIENPQGTLIETLSGVSSEHFNPSRFHLAYQDLRNSAELEALIKNSKFDAIIHLAAIVGVRSCQENEAAAWEINRDAAINLIKLADKYNVGHFLFASTYSVYGDQGGKVVTEESEVRPTHVYELSKVAVEKHLKQTTDFPYTIFRFATAAGLSFRTRFDLLSNQLSLEAGNKGHCCIYQGNSMRSFVHVRDIARAIHTTLDAVPNSVLGQIFNVGEAYGADDPKYGSLTCSKNELLQQIVASYKERGIEISSEASDFSEDARDAILIAKKFLDRVGFLPSLSLRDSIDEIRDIVIQHEANQIDPHSSEYYERKGESI